MQSPDLPLWDPIYWNDKLLPNAMWILFMDAVMTIFASLSIARTSDSGWSSG